MTTCMAPELLFLRDGARISGGSDNMLAIYIRDQKSKQVIYYIISVNCLYITSKG
jgi:hypothetical protein